MTMWGTHFDPQSKFIQYNNEWDNENGFISSTQIYETLPRRDGENSY